MIQVILFVLFNLNIVMIIMIILIYILIFIQVLTQINLKLNNKNNYIIGGEIYQLKGTSKIEKINIKK